MDSPYHISPPWRGTRVVRGSAAAVLPGHSQSERRWNAGRDGHVVNPPLKSPSAPPTSRRQRHAFEPHSLCRGIRRRRFCGRVPHFTQNALAPHRERLPDSCEDHTDAGICMWRTVVYFLLVPPFWYRWAVSPPAVLNIKI